MIIAGHDFYDKLNGILDSTIVKYSIHPDKIYCTGLGIGGFGTWAYAVKYPHKFAAIVPICGGGMIYDM